MSEFDLTDGVRKAFLAGVGAMALGAEKSQEIVDDLIFKGELTVEQGKALNAELSHRAKKAAEDAPDLVLRAKLRAMTPKERSEWLARAAAIIEELDAGAAGEGAEESAGTASEG